MPPAHILGTNIGQEEMDSTRRGPYRVSVRGRIPPDLGQRISELHARAILERLARESRSYRELLEGMELPDQQVLANG